MATAYWIEHSDFGNYINFTDDDSGGQVTVPTSSQIEIEYTGKPSTLTLTSSIDENVANLVLWGVLKTIYTLSKNRIAFSLANDNYNAQKILVNKLKNLHTFDISIKPYDY